MIEGFQIRFQTETLPNICKGSGRFAGAQALTSHPPKVTRLAARGIGRQARRAAENLTILNESYRRQSVRLGCAYMTIQDKSSTPWSNRGDFHIVETSERYHHHRGDLCNDNNV
jgi:hypothetical protein